jgi:hypothetical protein
MKQLNNTRQRYVRDERDKFEEIRLERSNGWGNQLEVVNMLQKVMEGSNILPSDKEQWLEDRRSFGYHLRHMYVRNNFQRFPFAEDSLWKDWAPYDRSQHRIKP